jgi:6-phosphofructokinase 2
VRRDPGGGGINVARVIHRLGGKALAVYAAGGSAGDELANLLDSEGLQHRPVRIRGQTRESFHVTDDKSGEQYRFILAGDALEQGEWTACAAAALAAVALSDYFVCSGSLPPGVPSDFYASATFSAKAKGAKTVVDTQGESLHAVLVSGVDIVKASARELGAYLGNTPTDARGWRDALGKVVQGGKAEIVAVTLGANGAVLVTPTQAWHAAVPQVRASTTVGAGDSFLGGLLLKLIAGCPADVALRYAAAAGTAALLTSGTGLCDPSDVERLNSEIAIAKL